MNRRPRLGLGSVLAGLCIALAAHVAAADPERPRALGGERLVEAMETAAGAAVVHVRATRALGGSGHFALVRVENPIVGEVAIGTELQIAWEELSSTRAPRFAKDERALIVFEPLSGASIWRSRLPDPAERSKTLGIAMRGNAFLRNPAIGTATLLEHYLALTPADREGPDGVAYLAQLAADGELPIAIDCVSRLDTRSDLDEKLSPKSARRLTRALVRADATPMLEDALIRLVRTHYLASMREPLEAMTGGEALAPPVVYAALAQLSDGLSSAQTRRLLAHGPERYREVAARNAGGESAGHELETLVRRDPSAAVRANAVERLVELRGDAAIESVAVALGDPEPAVRAAAAYGLGSLGASAVPELKRVVDANDPNSARAALAALSLGGTGESGDALREIAATHPDEKIREIANLALGGKIGDTHD